MHVHLLHTKMGWGRGAERLKHKKFRKLTMACTLLLEVTMTSFRISGMMESKRLKGQESLRVSAKAPPWPYCLLRLGSQMAVELQTHSQSLICFYSGPSNRVHTEADFQYSSQSLWAGTRYVCTSLNRQNSKLQAPFSFRLGKKLTKPVWAFRVFDHT